MVTAIVSTYNSAEFIRGCIEDLELQTIAEQLEIIVIDSASLQDEGWIVRELQQLHGNIRYLRTEQRETVYAAWNRAIGMAHGRYITNANTDDRHRRDAFELMVRVLEHNPGIDLVYADVIITRTPHETYEQHTAAGRYNWFDWDRNTLLDNGCFIGPQPMWRRSVHELYGGFDDSYVTSGDYEFWLRISQTSSFRHINQPLGLYLAYPDSIEHCNEDKKQQENQQLLNLYLQSANTGTLVGFKPLQQLNAPCGQVKPPEFADSNAAGIIATIDKLVGKGRSLPTELRKRYLESRLTVVSGDLSRETLTAYVLAAEQALLASQEWFVRRRAVYGGMKREEAAVRHTVRSEAMRQAELLVQRGAPDAAVDVLISKGIRSATDDPSVYGFLAGLLLAANRFQDVLDLLPEMPPATDPALALELQAICLAAFGNEAAADAAARQAITLGGNRARSLVVLGTLAIRNSLQLHAEGHFAQALEQDPACARAWLASGILLWGKGEQDRAWKAIRRAVEVNPLDDQAMTVFLETATRTERLPDALQRVMEAVDLYPDSRNLAVVRTRLLSQCGYDDKALQACESFLVRFGVNDVVLALALDLRHKIGVYDQLKQAGSESVSLCMIVKNEENCLARCLASARPVAHELIVVDTGSTDRTVDIARVFGAKVGYFPWTGNFAEARNRSLQQAQGSWILVLDADEVIAPRDYDVIRGLVLDAAATKTAWRVLTRNYTIRHPNGWCANDGSYPVEERGGGWFPSSKVRLFRNSRSVRFSGVVHEMVEDAAEKDGYQIGDAPFIVHHYGRLHDDGEADFEKKTKYYELGMQKLEGTPDDLTALRELAIQAAELKRYEEAIELWDRFLALQPDAVIALFNKGYALMMQEHYREALEVSRRVLDLEPAHKEAAFNYGSCELYVGDPQRATARLEDVLKSYPEHPPLLALLFVLDLATSRSEQAKNRFRLLKEKNYLVSDYLAARLAVLDLLGRTELAKSIRSTANSMGL